jgi:phosphoribosyl 1,2-cyclic phosphodiesterase
LTRRAPAGLRFRVLGSGSTGNATLVEGGGARVLVDAGLGPRQLADRLASTGVDPASIDVVLVSHEHGDHARGAAAFTAKWGMPVAGTRGTWQAAGFGAATLPGWVRLEPGRPHAFGELSVRVVPVPHDAAGPVAFVLSADGVSLGHATDLGHVRHDLVEAFGGCHALLLESNYDPAMLRDGPYPWALKERILGAFGHLSNGDVARFLERGLGEDCRRVVLAHLSQKNNHPELVHLAVEEALRRGGRPGTQVEVASCEGTEWVDVAPSPERGGRLRDAQLRLF